MGVIFLSIHGTMGMDIEEDWLFLLSIPFLPFAMPDSLLCMEKLGNELVLHNHNLLSITISFLVILGGIGFPDSRKSV